MIRKQSFRVFIMSLSIVLLFFGISSGQGLMESDVDPADLSKVVSPVEVDGVKLFYVRGISTFPAKERASTISRRIRKAAANHSINADSVRIITEETKFKIYAGTEFVMNVYNVDGENEGVSQSLMAELIQQKIVIAIKSFREERSRPVLIQNSLKAFGALIAMTLLLLFLHWLLLRINSRLQTAIKSKIDTVENKTFNLVRSNLLWRIVNMIFRLIKVSILIAAIFFFLQYILSLFPWTKGGAAYTLDLLLSPLRKLGISLINFLPSLAFLIVIYFVTRYLLRLIKLFFSAITQGGIVIKEFDPDWSMPTFRIVRVIIVAFAVVIAYPYIPGSDSSAFKGVSVFFGLLLSLGSSSFIGNLIAGYSMTYRGAFKKGDKIKVDDYVGFVVEQKLLVTRLRSVKNEEIVIPNSVLLNSNIINFNTRANTPGIILHTSVGIGYATPWRKVDAMLKLAADRTEGLLKEPPPFVLKKALGDFAVTYEINAYCNEVQRMHIYYNILHQNILDVFNENNVQIMTPAYEGDPETPKVVPKDQWNSPIAGVEDNTK
ncbi:MAG: mechanosensitive ion channel [Bacteroidia bacterium]|nr:mechanosensitive ion channel [Bacteroidia bacterium]